jgi:thiamine biosynthesis lipoprotein
MIPSGRQDRDPLPAVPRAVGRARPERSAARAASSRPGFTRFGLLLLLATAHAAETYSSVEDALARAYPDASSVVLVEPSLDAEQAKAVLDAAQPRARGKLGGVYLAHTGRSVHGVAFVDHVIGRTEDITYLGALDSEGAVARLEVLVYREPYGSEVRGRAWLERFKGRRHGEWLRLKREIPNIAGATMSCSGMVERIRFLLAFHDLVLAQQVPGWLPEAAAPADPGSSDPTLAEPATVSRAVVVGEPVLSVQVHVDQDRSAALAAADGAVAAAEAVDARLNAWRPDSELRALVAAGGGQASAQLTTLVEHAADLHRQTKGAFDPTIKPVIELWAAAVERGSAATDQELATALARSGFARLGWSGDGELRIPTGMDLDLSALHKGAALDAAAAVLRASGHRGSLDFGGSGWIAVGGPLRVELRDPLSPSSSWGSLELPADRALAVAAAGGRGWRIDGQPVAHLIDARNGRPVAPARAAAVVAIDAVAADGLATACCLLEPDAARALVLATPGAAALLRGADGALSMTGAWPEMDPPQDP